MKILVVATTFPRWKKDTEPSFVFYLCRELVAKGAQVNVLVPHAFGAKQSEVLDGVSVTRMTYFLPRRFQKLFYNGGALPNLKSSFLAKVQLPFFLLLLPIVMLNMLRKEKYDLIHCHWLIPQGLIGVILGKWFKVPVVCSAHAGDVFISKYKLVRSVLRQVIKKAALITVNSKATDQVVQQIHKADTTIIPMGVDLSTFKKVNAKKALLAKYGLEPNAKIILNVGRFAEKKGLKYLVEALPEIRKKVDNAVLMLVGFGPEERNLKQLATSLNIADYVIFCGKIPNDELPVFYGASDVFVLPSIYDSNGDTEGLGVVLLEAIATECPVIGSNVGGITDIIKDKETGLLIEEKNSSQIAEKVIEIITNSTLADELVINAKEHVIKNFTWEAVGEKFYSSFYELIKRKEG